MLWTRYTPSTFSYINSLKWEKIINLKINVEYMSTIPDIYLICEDNSIRVVLNKELKKELISSLKKIGKNYNQISKKLGLSYTTLWDYQNRRPSIPLLFFKKLKSEYNIDLKKNFEYLESGSLRNKTKIVRQVNKNLSKIVGAIAADGHLRKRKTRFKQNENSYHYELVLREEYLTNCCAFCD